MFIYMFASAHSGPFAAFSGVASFDTFLQPLGHGLRFTSIEKKDSTVALNVWLQLFKRRIALSTG